ncbi:hypothetical protein, partial [Thiolapillus sp.]
MCQPHLGAVKAGSHVFRHILQLSGDLRIRLEFGQALLSLFPIPDERVLGEEHVILRILRIDRAYALIAFVQEKQGVVDFTQACLRPRDRFWDIPVPKIDSAFDNLFVPQPSWSPSTTQQLRKLVAAPYL